MRWCDLCGEEGPLIPWGPMWVHAGCAYRCHEKTVRRLEGESAGRLRALILAIDDNSYWTDQIGDEHFLEPEEIIDEVREYLREAGAEVPE